MKKIFFVYRTARKKMLENYRQKTEPDNGLYGLNNLQKMGYQVNFSDIAYSRFNLLFWLFFPLQKIFINKVSSGFKLDQALLLLPKLNKNDVIITTTDSAGLPILFLKKIGLLEKKVIYITIGLASEFKREDSKFQSFLITLLKTADAIICYSPAEKNKLVKLIPEKSYNIRFVSPGIDIDYFKCSVLKKTFILSVGRDKSRDYKFLEKIALKFPSEEFMIVASKPNISGMHFPQNVKVLLDLPYFQVKRLYCQAKLVFLPLKEVNRAAGQIAFLESIASGNKIVVSKVKGIIETYPDLTNKSDVYLYKPNSIADASIKIKQALKTKHSKTNLLRYNSANYARNLSQLIEQI